MVIDMFPHKFTAMDQMQNLEKWDYNKNWANENSISKNITQIFICLADEKKTRRNINDLWKSVNLDFEFQLILLTSYISFNGLFLLSELHIVFY